MNECGQVDITAILNAIQGIKSDLARIESKIPSEERIVSRVIPAIKDLLDAANKSLENIIVTAIGSLKDLIIYTSDSLKQVLIQLIKSIFGSGDSIDYNRIAQIVRDALISAVNYDRISQIVGSAHQTTREIIVNQLYAKLEAGFFNLESLIKRLNFSVDYDRVTTIVGVAHTRTRAELLNAIGSLKSAILFAIAALIPAFRSAIDVLAVAIKSAITELGRIIADAIIKVLRELLKNPGIDYDRIAQIVNNAHQSTRQVIVNILSPKLEAGFANLESLIKALKLAVDYDRISTIVNIAHQTTRQVIVGILSPKLEAGFANLESLIKALKLSVDYDRISTIVNIAHQTTRQVIVNILSPKLEAGFANLESLIKALKLSVDYDRITRIVGDANQSTRQVIVGILSPKLEAGFANLESLIKALKNTVSPLKYVAINVQVFDGCKRTPNTLTYYPSFKTQSIKVIQGTEQQVALEFSRIAEIEGRRCSADGWNNLIVETVACVQQPDGTWKPETHEELIWYFGTFDDGEKIGGSQYSQIQNQFKQFADIATELCEAKNNESNSIAIAAVPEWWQIRPEAHRPQVIIQFGEVLESGKIGPPGYPITIPHPIADMRWLQCPIEQYTKGDTELILTLSDNSKVVLNCVDKDECMRVIGLLKTVIQPSYLEGSFLKVGERKGQPIAVKRVKPKTAKYFSQGLKNLTPNWIAYF